MSRTVLPVFEHAPADEIPPVIHQIWVGPPRPSWVDLYWEQVEEEATAQGFEVRHHGNEEYAKSLSARWLRGYDLHPAIWSDFYRLELLYRYGGVYVDSDNLLLGDLRPWVGQRRPWAGRVNPVHYPMEDTFYHFNNAHLGFPAKHKFLMDVWLHGIYALERGVKSALHLAGPGAFGLEYLERRPDVELPHGPFIGIRQEDIAWEGSLGRPATADEWRRRHPDSVLFHIASESWRSKWSKKQFLRSWLVTDHQLNPTTKRGED